MPPFLGVGSFFSFSRKPRTLSLGTTVQHVNPGCECDRAHLLTTVADNLDLAPDYYARATLTYKLRVGKALHGLLAAEIPRE